MECQNFPFSGIIVRKVLLRQVAHGERNEKNQLWQVAHRESNKKDQLWFQISENLICLSVREWCPVTRLCYGKDVVLKKQETV